jgi:FAD-dependent urate hydroxylase
MAAAVQSIRDTRCREGRVVRHVESGGPARVRSALVIGGGVAGMAGAMALAKAGITATVFEAHPSGADGVGVFLTLASNGIDALRVLGAAEGVLAAGFATPSITLRSYTGKLLGHTRTGSTLPDRTPSHTLRRADLYSALRRQAGACGIPVVTGRRLVRIEEQADGVVAGFADGSEASADVLIGADGVWSFVRRHIDRRAAEPRYSGLLTTGGYARDVPVDSPPGTYEMIFGRRAFFGYVAAHGGEVWWFANLPSRHAPGRDRVRPAPEQVESQLLELFRDDAGPAVGLIRATGPVSTPTAIHTLPHLRRWYGGRCVVIGDAAHAPSPSSGQGASLAIEDAVVLARCLRDTDSPRSAFTTFERARRERVERIVKYAERINSNKAPGPVARAVRDLVLPSILRLAANSKVLRDAFDYRIAWPADPARTS